MNHHYGEDVAFFTPLAAPLPLPPLRSAIERPVMDWKAVDSSKPLEKAKDVAAFANHLGGTILIGAQEVDGHLSAYVGMTPSQAAALRDEFSKSVNDRCFPKPMFDFYEYPSPADSTKLIVAVNVWPSLQLVGVRVEAHKPTEGYGGKSFVFPVRAGTDANYLEPTQLAMYMTPHVRRNAVILSRIPKDELVAVRSPTGTGTHEYRAYVLEVREDENSVALGHEADRKRRLPSIPLDRITTVFEDWDTGKNKSYWRIYVQLWNV